MKKFILISPKNRTAYNFRGDLIRAIHSRGYEIIVTGPNRDNVDRIEALGARFVEIPMNKNGVNLFSDLRYLWRLYRLMKDERPDVSLGYTIKPVIYGTIAARLACIKKRNSMITGVGYLFTATSLKSRVLRFFGAVLYRVGLSFSHHVIFQNPDDCDEFVTRGLVSANKCHIVNGSGVNMEYFRPLPLPKRTTFFMLSRVLYSKGIREYLQAAKRVKTFYPDMRFMLLGAVENIPDSLTEKDLEPYIHSGIIDYYGETTDVREYIRQCSVFVLPSYREGTPRTVLEAMAMRRAIITTDTPGCRETVIDGRTGFLVPPRDIDALADKMLWFIEHLERLDEMSECSLQLCREKYEVGLINQRMMEIMNIIK